MKRYYLFKPLQKIKRERELNWKGILHFCLMKMFVSYGILTHRIKEIFIFISPDNVYPFSENHKGRLEL